MNILLLLLLVQESKATMKAVPRQIMAATLTTPNGEIKSGASTAEVLKVLGPGAKAGKLYKNQTSDKILRAGELMAFAESGAAPPLFNPLGQSRSVRDRDRRAGSALELSEELAGRCGLCDAQWITRKVGKNEEIRVMLMGPVGSAELKAEMVIYGRERSKPAAWRESADGVLETVAEDGSRVELRGGRDLLVDAK